MKLIGWIIATLAAGCFGFALWGTFKIIAVLMHWF